MLDVIFIVTGLALFALTAAYARFCVKL